jgi:DNA repair protein RecO (recombination protein O)
MAAPRAYRTEAVVLKATDLGEADRILTLFTLHHGKLRVVGKGVRRPGSRLGGHLDLLTHASLMLARARSLDIVTQVETLHSDMAMRDDLWRTGLACSVAELVDRLTEEGHEDRATFAALLEVLDRVATDPDPELAVRLFEATLLDRLGYRPQLHACVRCRAELRRVDSFYSAPAGGVLCPACGPTEPTARPISANAFAMLRLLQAGSHDVVSRVRKDEDLRREIEVVLRDQIRYLLERDLKSASFLNRLRAMPA